MKLCLFTSIVQFVLIFYVGQNASSADLIPVSKTVVSNLADREVPTLLQTLNELVSIESGSADLEGLTRIRDVITRRFDSMGISYQVIESTSKIKTGAMLLATVKGQGVAKIALIAHMDTVYQKGDSYRQPFKVVGDRAYGLGIEDDRSGIAVILHTLNILKSSGISSFGQLSILINADEEIGSPGSKELIMALGHDHDLVISFEGSGANTDYVRLATSSIARADMYVHGRASHAGSNPTAGRNALYEMAHQILQTQDISNLAPGVKFNWTMAQSGTVRNMIPSEAVAFADIRANRMSDFDLVENELKKRIQNHKIPDVLVEVNFTRSRPPLIPNALSLEVAKLSQIIATEINWPYKILELPTGGGTDAAYAQQKSSGAVIESFGLQGAGAHSDDAEYILIGSIKPKLYITTRLIDLYSIQMMHLIN
jgi:glutamate carboxypeptidase